MRNAFIFYFIKPQTKQDSKGKIKMASFSRTQLENAFKFMESQVHLMRPSPADVIEIYTTGVGGSQFSSDICKRLNVK